MMKMSEKEKKKYPPIDVEEEIRGQDKAKAKFSMDLVDVESALTEYLDELDPIMWTNPKTKETKAIAWVRRPSMKQLKALIPPEMSKYMDDPSKMPKSTQKKYENFFYEKMSELVAIPEYTPEQWREKANPWLIRKFWEHISEITKLMEGQIEGF